jgi:DNA-binding Lrp family transcriptional regulator
MIRAALAVARTPARRRIVRELMRDAARSNRSVAQAAGTNHMRVRAVRLEMEAAGLVAPFRARSRRRTPSLATPARDLARLALARDPARPNRQVAQEAAVSYPVVMRVRHQMEDAGDIKRYRGPSRNGT